MPQQRRVLLIARWFPPTTGGIERYLERLYAGLSEQHEVLVVTPRGQGGLEGRSYEVEEVWNSTRWSTGSKWPAVPLAWGTVRRGRNAHVLCAGHVLSGASALMTSVLLRKPLIIHAYGMELANGRLMRLKGMALRRAALVVSISDYTTALLRSLGVPESRIVLIPPGVDTALFTSHARTNSRNGVRFLTVSRLDPNSRYKGHDVVASALARLATEGFDFEWRIVGDGPDRNFVERLVDEAGIRTHTTLLGHVPIETLVREYQAADAVVMPNRLGSEGESEGFGMVFTEAQACGTPVIAGLAGGTGAAVADGVGGVRVDGASVESVYSALKDVLVDPGKWARMGESGQGWVRTHHNWTARVNELNAAVAAVCR